MVKQIQYEEMEQHTTKESCWLSIHGKVYDITKYLDEHPGGEDVMLEVAGQDASEAFEDIGHSKSAREMLKQYEIGELVGTPVKKAKGVAKGGAAGGSGGMSKILIPVVIVGGIAFLAQRFMA